MGEQYQFTPFDVGQVKAHMHHDLGPTAIAAILWKADGVSQWSVNGVKGIMDKLDADPNWRGERAEGSGAPRKTSKKQDASVVSYVLNERGNRKTTVSSVKRQFPELRKLSNTLIESRLHDADLGWLPRRKKSRVGKIYQEPRIQYCRMVLRMQQKLLEKWAYFDGTVYFLDRTDAEHEQSLQAALGSHVWRRYDGKDALWEENIGPSAYNKAQGKPVRIWGMLALGRLSVHILEEWETMNQDVYCDLIEERFEGWMADATHLVCDFEGLLRTKNSLAEVKRTGLQLVPKYPRCSQDFNAIENAWDLVKQRLDETIPKRLETRDEFIVRYHATVQWVNKHRAHRLWYLSTNQKERAIECLRMVPPGSRTSW